MLEVVRNFLKTQYQVHLNKNDDCGTHSIKFAVNKIYPNGTKVSKLFKGKWYPGKIASYKKPFYKIDFDDSNIEDWEEDKTQANVDEKKKPCNYNACKFLHYFCHQLPQQQQKQM